VREILRRDLLEHLVLILTGGVLTHVQVLTHVWVLVIILTVYFRDDVARTIMFGVSCKGLLGASLLDLRENAGTMEGGIFVGLEIS